MALQRELQISTQAAPKFLARIGFVNAQHFEDGLLMLPGGICGLFGLSWQGSDCALIRRCCGLSTYHDSRTSLASLRLSKCPLDGPAGPYSVYAGHSSQLFPLHIFLSPRQTKAAPSILLHDILKWDNRITTPKFDLVSTLSAPKSNLI